MCFIFKMIKELIINRHASTMPVKPDRIFFHNIWFKYNDNTKALAEAYHKLHPNYELIYEIDNKTDCSVIPDYLRKTIKDSVECRKLLYSSKVVIDNDWGIIKKSGKGIKGLIACNLLKKTISPNSLYVSTGHGTPLKKIGSDSISDNSDSFVTSTQIMFVSDNHSKEVYERITKGQIKDFVFSGSPRNDILYNYDYQQRIKKKLGLLNKKLLLFAPTFRTKIINGQSCFIGIEKLSQEINEYADILINVLKQRFGGDWKIGIRVHPGASGNLKINNGNIVDANELEDMAEYLCCADCLVTDYSSCFFDYMITKRPCVLLWEDEEEYALEERGLYYSNKELPYPVVHSFKELISTFKSFKFNEINNSIETFMVKNNFSDNRHASEVIVRYIDEKLRELSRG